MTKQLFIHEFDRLAARLAHTAMHNEETWDALLAAGVDHRDWPECIARTLMGKFAAIKGAEQSHQIALFELTKVPDLDLLEEIADGYALPNDANIVKREYHKMLLRKRAHSLAHKLLNSPDEAETFVREFQNGVAVGTDVYSLADEVDWFFEEKAALQAAGKTQVNLPSWPILSEKIGGFNPGRLGILIADTGFGKTNIATQFAVDASETMPTLYFNMEMSKYDFTQRIMASMTSTSYSEMNKQTWNTPWASDRAKRRKLFYTGGKDLALEQIQAFTRRFKRQHDIQFLVVDYDQKIVLPRSGDEEWREIHRAAVALESLAKELGMFVLLLAQSNFEGQMSGSKRAMFPAAVGMYFSRDDQGVSIRAVKNRFGPRNACVKVEYKPEASSVRELEAISWVDPKTKKFV